MSDMKTAEANVLKAILEGEKTPNNRSVLGGMVPIRLFQAVRLIALGSKLENMVGAGSRALVYQSGQHLGMVLGDGLVPQANKDLGEYVKLLQGVVKELHIGILVLEKADTDKGLLTLRVDECVSCAGVDGIKEPICHFEAGMIGGMVRAFVKTPTKAIETRCHAIGDDTCGVDVQILK